MRAKYLQIKSVDPQLGDLGLPDPDSLAAL